MGLDVLNLAVLHSKLETPHWHVTPHCENGASAPIVKRAYENFPSSEKPLPLPSSLHSILFSTLLNFVQHPSSTHLYSEQSAGAQL